MDFWGARTPPPISVCLDPRAGACLFSMFFCNSAHSWFWPGAVCALAPRAPPLSSSPFKSEDTTTEHASTPPSLPMASSALSVVAPHSKRRKVPPDGFSVVADALNAVFYSLMKPTAATPLGHINTASRHLKTSYSSSLKTVAATP